MTLSSSPVIARPASRVVFSLTSKQAEAICRLLNRGPAIMSLLSPSTSPSLHQMRLSHSDCSLRITDSGGEVVLEILFTSTPATLSLSKRLELGFAQLARS